MRASQLLALSFDHPGTSSITLKSLTRPGQGSAQPLGWGFGWYPADDFAAVVIKDSAASGDHALTTVQSDIFVGHIRGARERLAQGDTQPFCRSFAGRDWIFAHQGELRGELSRVLPLGDAPAFEPIGHTDSEHAFCWLLELIRARGARRLTDIGWEELHNWLRALNDLGTATFVLSDGENLLVHQDRYRQAGLCWIRRPAPQPPVALETDDLAVDLGKGADERRTMVAVASVPLSDEAWRPMYPGQLLVFRQGALSWDSHAGGAPEAGAAPPAIHVPQKLESQLLSIVHQTVYGYARPVERSAHLFRLKPLTDETQTLVEYQLIHSPTGISQDLEDVFGNRATTLQIGMPYRELCIETRSLVRVHPLPADLAAPRRVMLPYPWMPWQRQMMSPYLLPPELPESELLELADFALSFARRQNFDLLETLADLNATIHGDFAYVTGSTSTETSPFDVYESRRGVCQDFTNLFICLARLLGIPARYRVGYVFTGHDHQNTAQSQATHAWAELYLPEVGWRGFDPTNGSLAGADHVRVACGRHHHDASPTSGTIYQGGGAETLRVMVKVEVVE